MINFIYSLMTDKRNGVMFVPAKLILYILSLCYGLAIFVRKLLYRFKIFKSEGVPLKVISVGNLTLGGTGKTPFVIMLSRILNDQMKKGVSVLIRGYGWDEQTMLKNSLQDIPILVGEDRVRSSHRAVKLYGSDVAVLDDGFQHWEMLRDLDIVLVDSRNPFGNERLFPRGILREPKSALARADIVVFTKINKKVFDLNILKEEIKKINDKIGFLEAAHTPRYVYDIKARKMSEISAIRGKRLVLISSIGDPAYFEETVRDLGSDVAEHIIFADHHNYAPGDMKRILRRCEERSFDFVLTTEKDAVKFRRMNLSFGKYPLMVLGVEMEITSGKEILIARLHSLFHS